MLRTVYAMMSPDSSTATIVVFGALTMTPDVKRQRLMVTQLSPTLSPGMEGSEVTMCKSPTLNYVKILPKPSVSSSSPSPPPPLSPPPQQQQKRQQKQRQTLREQEARDRNLCVTPGPVHLSAQGVALLDALDIQRDKMFPNAFLILHRTPNSKVLTSLRTLDSVVRAWCNKNMCEENRSAPATAIETESDEATAEQSWNDDNADTMVICSTIVSGKRPRTMAYSRHTASIHAIVWFLRKFRRCTIFPVCVHSREQSDKESGNEIPTKGGDNDDDNDEATKETEREGFVTISSISELYEMLVVSPVPFSDKPPSPKSGNGVDEEDGTIEDDIDVYCDEAMLDNSSDEETGTSVASSITTTTTSSLSQLLTPTPIRTGGRPRYISRAYRNQVQRVFFLTPRIDFWDKSSLGKNSAIHSNMISLGRGVPVNMHLKMLKRNITVFFPVKDAKNLFDSVSTLSELDQIYSLLLPPSNPKTLRADRASIEAIKYEIYLAFMKRAVPVKAVASSTTNTNTNSFPEIANSNFRCRRASSPPSSPSQYSSGVNNCPLPAKTHTCTVRDLIGGVVENEIYKSNTEQNNFVSSPNKNRDRFNAAADTTTPTTTKVSVGTNTNLSCISPRTRLQASSSVRASRQQATTEVAVSAAIVAAAAPATTKKTATIAAAAAAAPAKNPDATTSADATFGRHYPHPVDYADVNGKVDVPGDVARSHHNYAFNDWSQFRQETNSNSPYLENRTHNSNSHYLGTDHGGSSCVWRGSSNIHDIHQPTDATNTALYSQARGDTLTPRVTTPEQHQYAEYFNIGHSKGHYYNSPPGDAPTLNASSQSTPYAPSNTLHYFDDTLFESNQGWNLNQQQQNQEEGVGYHNNQQQQQQQQQVYHTETPSALLSSTNATDSALLGLNCDDFRAFLEDICSHL